MCELLATSFLWRCVGVCVGVGLCNCVFADLHLCVFIYQYVHAYLLPCLLVCICLLCVCLFPYPCVCVCSPVFVFLLAWVSVHVCLPMHFCVLACHVCLLACMSKHVFSPECLPLRLFPCWGPPWPGGCAPWVSWWAGHRQSLPQWCRTSPAAPHPPCHPHDTPGTTTHGQ